MPKLSEAILNFLRARRTPNNADLIDRWDIGMETQINVAADNGEPVDGYPDQRIYINDADYSNIVVVYQGDVVVDKAQAGL